MGRRPCWVILVARGAAAVRRVVAAYQRDVLSIDPDLRPWQVVAGSDRYSAVIEMEPGSEHSGEVELAELLSRETEEPCYVLWTDVDYPRAQVFRDGGNAGELASVWPDDVARHLGCSFPALEPMATGLEEGALEPIQSPPPGTNDDDPKIDCLTAAQWAHAMTVDGMWAEALDPSPEAARELLGALEHPRVEVRRVAARMARCFGPWSEPPGGFDAFLARVTSIAEGDPDEEVRRLAAASAATLRDGLADA